jgi:hypothetical protein
MQNPIPFSGLFATPTLQELQANIEQLPAPNRALVYTFVMATLNACHAIVEDEMVDVLN